MEEKLDRLLELTEQNNKLLQEILSLVQKAQDPNYLLEENTTDFIMNIVANLVAAKIQGKT